MLAKSVKFWENLTNSNYTENLIWSYHRLIEKYKAWATIITSEINNKYNHKYSSEGTKDSEENIDKLETQIILNKIESKNRIESWENLLFEYFDKFAFDDIEFADLPIAYEFVDNRLIIFWIWYDDQLWKELERFMNDYKKCLRLNNFKMLCLPTSMLEQPEVTSFALKYDSFILKMYLFDDSLRFKLDEEVINKRLGDNAEIQFINNYLLKVYVYEFNWNSFREQGWIVTQFNFLELK